MLPAIRCQHNQQGKKRRGICHVSFLFLARLLGRQAGYKLLPILPMIMDRWMLNLDG